MPAGPIRKGLYRLGFLVGQSISWFIGISCLFVLLPNAKPYPKDESKNLAVIISCYVVFLFFYILHMYSYWMVMLQDPGYVHSHFESKKLWEIPATDILAEQTDGAAPAETVSDPAVTFTDEQKAQYDQHTVLEGEPVI